MILFLSFLITANANSNNANQANKLLHNLNCGNFQTEFVVTKAVLYNSASYPKNDNFHIGTVAINKNKKDGYTCVRKLIKQSVSKVENGVTVNWEEKRLSVAHDWFGANDQLNCQTSENQITQDEDGIIHRMSVSGLSTNGNANTINFICFYPLRDGITYSEIQANGNYGSIMAKAYDGTAEYNSNSFTIYKMGNLEAGFEVFDVRNALTGRFFPRTNTARMARVGDAIFAGVRPKPNMVGRVDRNPVTLHPNRWDYFINDCIWSGVNVTGHFSAIQLFEKNCKNKDYHVQRLSKFGRKDGQMFMFEAMAFNDADIHYLTCDVSICLKRPDAGDTWTRAWTGCYEACDSDQFVEQDANAEDADFELPTTVVVPTVTQQELTATAPITLVNGNTVAANTQQQSTEFNEASNDNSDIVEARTKCVEIWNDGDYENYWDSSDPDHSNLYALCQIMQDLYPDYFV